MQIVEGNCASKSITKLQDQSTLFTVKFRVSSKVVFWIVSCFKNG